MNVFLLDSLLGTHEQARVAQVVHVEFRIFSISFSLAKQRWIVHNSHLVTSTFTEVFPRPGDSALTKIAPGLPVGRTTVTYGP